MVTRAADALFMPWIVAALFGTGVYLSVRLRFIQVRRLGEAFRSFLTPRDPAAGGKLPPFQSFMTAVATTIGTGNIAGVATAIVSGGPGALFWIWAYGVVAAAIKFAEAVLGILYRQEGEGAAASSGAMFYLRDGVKAPRLAWLFALVAGIAALATTPFTQPNSVAVVLESELAVPAWATGAGLALLTWIVVVGGIQSIGRVMARLAPLKVALYLGGGLVVLAMHGSRLPEVFALIFREAFSMEAAGGGGLGILVAMRYGVARGIYANEAGYGNAAVPYGTAQTADPRRLGLNAVMETFIVSFVTSSISGLTILATGVWRSGATSTALVAEAFEQGLPGVGGVVVALCAFLFGYGTLIGWSYYGEQYLKYVFGRRVAVPFLWVYCLLIPIGAMARVEFVWAWGDLLNGLQILPNLIALLVLSGSVAAVASGARPGATRHEEPRP